MAVPAAWPRWSGSILRADVDAAAPLFAHLLGAGFARLPATVQRLHAHQGVQRWHGQVTVSRGRGGLARLCAWATGLPPAGQGPMSVDIAAVPGREQWTRRVGRHAMASTLWADDGLLCERLGLVVFGFRLEEAGGALHWRVAR